MARCRGFGRSVVVALLAALTVIQSGCGVLAVFLDPDPKFDAQAHRGGRGLAPENTLAAFRQALTYGVTTFETDLGMTRDGVLVLAHDPHLNPALVRGADGQWLKDKGPTLFSLQFADLALFDIGRLNPAHPYSRNWPQQRPADGERFPKLDALFELAQGSGRDLRFNLETKITPDAPNETADAEVFARAVVRAVQKAGLERRVTIQSFDWRTLLAVKRIAPRIKTACLTIDAPAMSTLSKTPGDASTWHAGLKASDYGGSLPALVKAAGCDTWSMFWRNLTPQSFAQAKSYGLKVLPWTVNETADMRALIELGVDGLITDYPDRLRRLLDTKK